jgi:hypothetical protein
MNVLWNCVRWLFFVLYFIVQHNRMFNFEVQTHMSAYFAGFFNMYLSVLFHSSHGRLFCVTVYVVFSTLKHPVTVNWREYGDNWYRGADKYLARPTSRCIVFDGENISFDASRVTYVNSNNIPPVMNINNNNNNNNKVCCSTRNIGYLWVLSTSISRQEP